jgi:hypothetical protein
VKPSVGRIVLVPADPAKNNGANVAPAIITRVWSDTCVNLRVLLDSDETTWRTSVVFVNDLAAAEHTHVWAWPPRV